MKDSLFAGIAGIADRGDEADAPWMGSTQPPSPLFDAPSTPRWPDAVERRYNIDPTSWPSFMQSGTVPTPPSGHAAPNRFDPSDPWAAAAYRIQQGQRPTFGRGDPQRTEDAIRAAAVSALDPFGIPSWLIGQVSPEARDAIRAQYEDNPAAATVGSLAMPMPFGRAVGTLALDFASRMARAKGMGFFTHMPLYHGTNAAFSAFDLGKGGSTTGASTARRGVWLSSDPAIAEEFATMAHNQRGGSPQIYRLFHRTEKPARIDLTGDELGHEIAGTLDDLWKQGYDTVWLTNYKSPGGRVGDIFIVKDPSQLRSPQAVFDPAKRNSPNLLAGLAGAGVMAPYFADDSLLPPHHPMPERQ